MQPNATFRTSQRRRHATAFRLAEKIARTVGSAVIRDVPLNNEVARVLDMLMQQAWRAHCGVCVLAERALVEDAAVLSRRLLELAAQSSYITVPVLPEERNDRARRFLAKVWVSSPADIRERLDRDTRAQWETSLGRWRKALPENPRHWWPTFQQIFAALGSEEAYETDYRFLSGVAHGGSSFLVLDYAGRNVPGLSLMNPSPILIHASRYLLVSARAWNMNFAFIDDNVFAQFAKEISQARGLTRTGPVRRG